MKRKWIAVIVLSVCMIITASGCAKEQDTQTTAIRQESLADTASQSNDVEPAADSKSTQTELLDGYVRGIDDNGIVILKATTEETPEDGVVMAMAPAPGYETAEDYVSVNFTDQTTIELHIVKNGGANPEEDVTVQEASLSDIKDDMNVTLEGSYDKDVFVAKKVVLYEFV